MLQNISVIDTATFAGIATVSATIFKIGSRLVGGILFHAREFVQVMARSEIHQQNQVSLLEKLESRMERIEHGMVSTRVIDTTTLTKV